MKTKMLIPLLLALLVTACEADDPHKRAKTGAAVGAVIGAVVGHQADDDHGAAVGAVVGGLAGYAAGDYMDEQQADLEKKLAREEARKELSITRMSDGSLRVGIASDATFDVAKADIKPEAEETYSKIASTLRTYKHTIVHVVGHTDSDGSDAYNQDLSERRAGAVGGLFLSRSVPSERLRMEGRGEREPIASNATADGKRRNRRVDIVIKPIIKDHREEAETPPPYLGS